MVTLPLRPKPIVTRTLLSLGVFAHTPYVVPRRLNGWPTARITASGLMPGRTSRWTAATDLRRPGLRHESALMPTARSHICR